MNKKQSVAFVIILTGMLISVSGAILPRLFPQDAFWNETQAKQQSQAAARLHQETFEAAEIQHSKETTREEKDHAAQELAAAKEKFRVSRKALEEAQFWRSTLPRGIRWFGAGIAAVGAIIWFAFRPVD